MQAITLGITIFTWCTGCGVGDVKEPGGPDAAAGDGGDQDSGVSVEFAPLGPNGQPATGGPLEFELFTITQLTMQLHDLQLIGDTAPSGDLVEDSRFLHFPNSENQRVSFVQAPPGIYSRLTFEVERSWAEEELPEGFEGERLSVRVKGEAHIDNKDRAFIYDCEDLTAIELDFDREVTPGVPGQITVELDLLEWFDGVDWEMLDSQGNPNQPIMIGGDENEETAALLRAELTTAFRVRE